MITESHEAIKGQNYTPLEFSSSARILCLTRVYQKPLESMTSCPLNVEKHLYPSGRNLTEGNCV